MSQCPCTLRSVLLVQSNSIHFHLVSRKLCKNILAQSVWDFQSTHEKCCSNRRRRISYCSLLTLVLVVSTLSSHCNQRHRLTIRKVRNRRRIFFYQHRTVSSHISLCISIGYFCMRMIGICDKSENRETFIIILTLYFEEILDQTLFNSIRFFTATLQHKG